MDKECAKLSKNQACVTCDGNRRKIAKILLQSLVDYKKEVTWRES